MLAEAGSDADGSSASVAAAQRDPVLLHEPIDSRSALAQCFRGMGDVTARVADRLDESVALPLFGVLCLMEVSGGTPLDAGFPLVPFHHFHAPLIPVVFWVWL